MLTLDVVFWMYVILLAFIGGMRGWAKELLVLFSVILGFFLITVLERFVPFIRDTLSRQPESLFWMRFIIIFSLVFFGYQTPKLPKIAESGRFMRDKLQDVLLGVFIGAVNGYMIVGTILSYMHQAGYPFDFVIAPIPHTGQGQALLKLLAIMPPEWLGTPTIYFAVGIAFVFILVVFI